MSKEKRLSNTECPISKDEGKGKPPATPYFDIRNSILGYIRIKIRLAQMEFIKACAIGQVGGECE